MTLAIILAGTAMFISGTTFLVVLVLLGRKDFQYATKRDLQEALDRLSLMGRNQAKLYRYLEAIDGHLGSNGHRVLIPRVPGKDTSARDR